MEPGQRVRVEKLKDQIEAAVLELRVLIDPEAALRIAHQAIAAGLQIEVESEEQHG